MGLTLGYGALFALLVVVTQMLGQSETVRNYLTLGVVWSIFFMPGLLYYGRYHRKAAGSVFLVLYIFVYIVAAMEIAAAIAGASDGNKLIEGVYFVAAGLAWIIPLRPLMLWMHRSPHNPRPHAPG